MLKNLRHVYAGGDETAYLVPDESLQAFCNIVARTIGDAYFRTPRNTIKAFLDMLAVIDQNPTISWDHLIHSVAIDPEMPSDMDINMSDLSDMDEDDGLADFSL